MRNAAVVVAVVVASLSSCVSEPLDRQREPADQSVDTPPPPDPFLEECEPFASELDAVASTLDSERERMGIGGAAVAVVVGDCLFARGFGVEREGGAAVDAHTRFQLASMTKTLTAVAALSLEEDGVVDRSAPIAQYVPATTSTASLDDMLAHRAGYPTDLTQSFSLDLREYIEGNASEPMWAPPGEVWLYSNPGFAIAGLALENAAGQAFEDVIVERVFERAGMSDAVMGAHLAGDEARMARGRSGSSSASFDEIEPTESYLASTYYGPMGGAWASADDLAHFMKAFIDGGDGALLGEASVVDMSTSRGSAYGAAVGYGQGLFVAYEGTVYHGGSVAGFLSEMDIHRESGFGVAVLSAADWDFPYDTIIDAFQRLGPSTSTAPPPDDEAFTHEELVGTYRDDVVLGDVVVSAAAGGALTMTCSELGEGELALDEVAPGVFLFFYEPWGAEIDVTFDRGDVSGTLYAVTLLGIAAKQ